ncbi:MAG: A/G-specific adenine glycosylase [Proteobacteria bacterium]|nr:A/G-specific adenine glycosylase [Pseudomonadota bacterium]
MENFFNQSLLAWYKNHGRHDLPWQINPTPYKVWVSEIMLQQTQVSTVIPYFQRFINCFSSFKSLYEANIDQVLRLWSGLGYYARARNLHRCAQIVCQEFDGVFPCSVAELSQLPGIGRSTAGAILSFSMQVRAPILDGNVRRVLTRFYAVEGSVNDKQVSKKLWQLAEQNTPLEAYRHYNQAIMDLGATICTRSTPLCAQCPVQKNCSAFVQGRVKEFPYRNKVKPKAHKYVQMLMIRNPYGAWFLEKRPPTGIWGGLWSFPQCDLTQDVSEWCEKNLNGHIVWSQELPAFKHVFTHFELTIHPKLIHLNHENHFLNEPQDKIWYDLSHPAPGGFAAPVTKLFQVLIGKTWLASYTV